MPPQYNHVERERFGGGVRGETQCLVNYVPRSVGSLIGFLIRERFGGGVRGETQCLVNYVPRSVGSLIGFLIRRGSGNHRFPDKEEFGAKRSAL